MVEFAHVSESETSVVNLYSKFMQTKYQRIPISSPANAQYTPQTLTRLQLRRRCVHNSQLVGAVSAASLNKFADNEVELRHIGGAFAPVGGRDPVYNLLRC